MDVAAQNFWQPTNGPFGGEIRVLAINPTTQDIFAGTLNGGVFRSTNNGDSWTAANTGLTNTDIRTLAINASGHIFAGTNGGGVFRSTNNGSSWTVVNTGLTSLTVYSLVINASGYIFAGTYGRGVFRSTNNGSSWTAVNTGLISNFVDALAINASGHIFAGGSGYVFRSMNNGDSWTAANTGLTNLTHIRTFAINASGYVFAGTETRVFRSTNNGGSWTETDLTQVRVNALASNASGHIFAGTDYGYGVFRSTNNGGSWTGVNTGLTGTEILALAINSSGHIFAGTVNGGVLRSTNNGDSWTAVNTSLTNTNVLSLAINSSGHIFAGTGLGGVFRSTNNGDSWTGVNTGLTGTEIRALAINANGHIFAGTFGGGVFRSTNSGTSWTAVNTDLTNTRVLALAINASGHIFAGTDGGLFRSTNNGGSWTAVNTGLTNTNVYALAINSSGDIFAGTNGNGLFRSTNNGDSWTAVNTGLTTTVIRALAINASGHIFSGTDGNGVFRSTNNGDSWTAVNIGLTTTVIRALAINASDHIFAGTFGGGVFRSTNNGDSWTAVNTGLTNTRVFALAINASGYIFTGTDGVFRSVETTGVAPIAITNTVTNINSTSVTLNGTVNPNNLSTAVKFEYGTTIGYGSEITATTSPVNGTSAVAVSAVLTGLSSNTLYHYRVVGMNSAGTTNGGDGTFITSGSPTVTTNAATNVSTSSATLNGTIIPNGLNTTVKFQYGTTTSYGSEISATPSPVTGTNAVSVSAMLTGLAANALFHYRVVGTNSAGTTNGDDQTFTTTTAGNVPAVATNAATNIGTTSATLNGTVNSNGLSTSVKFEYGTTTNYSTEATATPNPITGPSAVAINATITGLTPNVTYHYRAVGTNSAGTTNGSDQTFITSIDQTAPNISHTAITSAPSGQSQTIGAILIDNSGIQSAVLNYRVGGASAYTAVAMSKTSGDNYQVAIPVGWITERGVEYYISAQDATGNKATFPTTNAETKPQVIQVTNSNLQFLVSTPVKAYRMISIPFDLNDKFAASVLQDDFTGAYDQTLWRLLRYVNPTTNIEFGASGFPDFAPGTGFWLITKEAKRLDAGAGKSVTTAQNFVITLPAGWSQIGNPFAFTVNWSDVIKGTEVENKLWGYQGTLNEATGYDMNRTQLVPFEGYFVNNKGSTLTTIEIPPKAATGSAVPKPVVADWKSALQSNEWALQITAACDRYLDKDNYLGSLNNASDEWDANDFSEAPFFDQHVALYFPHPEWKKYPDLYTGDFRETKAEGDYWDFVVKSEVAKFEVARSEVVLKLAEVQNLPADWEIVLLDKASRVAINFSEQKQYTFPSGNGKTVREFRIVVGKKDFVETNDLNLAGVPQAFALGQNYPNPFNPSTRIDYELPITSYVKISVYNLSGQLVRPLFDGEQSAGRYTVSWDGKNAEGVCAASGIYLARMEAGPSTGSGQGFVAVRKMIVTK